MDTHAWLTTHLCVPFCLACSFNLRLLLHWFLPITLTHSPWRTGISMYSVVTSLSRFSHLHTHPLRSPGTRGYNLHWISWIARIPSLSQANALTHSHRHLWPSQREVLAPVWSGVSAASPPPTARCMQLNRIKVISPTEVIASRWFASRNMLLMKLLSHCGCALVWRSMRESAPVHVVCFGCAAEWLWHSKQHLIRRWLVLLL